MIIFIKILFKKCSVLYLFKLHQKKFKVKKKGLFSEKVLIFKVQCIWSCTLLCQPFSSAVDAYSHIDKAHPGLLFMA